ncbi:MAG: serine/threonine-protein kinase [Vulcanimicrobiota bacterium]
MWMCSTLPGFAQPKEFDPPEYVVTFRTFPTCSVYVWDAQSDTRAIGHPCGPSNRKSTPIAYRGNPLKVYFVYGNQAAGLDSKSVSELDQTGIAHATLVYGDLQKGVYPDGGFPLFLLTTPSAWLFFARANWPAVLLLVMASAAWQTFRRKQRRRRDLLATTTTLGRFTLERSLGKGGAGEVFRAHDDRGEQVALKLLHSGAQESEEVRKRFQAEIQICLKLNHPNIVRLSDWGQQGDMLYLAMELLEGETLGARLRREGKLTPAEFTDMVLPLCSALQSLHDQGLVHRDLKPDNIFLRLGKGPALMDFGIAIGQDMTRATQTGSAVGTPSYMAPEQTRGLFEPATDQYALGVVAFVCLTGRRPFEADDAASMAYLHVHANPPLPSSYAPELPAGTDTVVLRMLSKKPSQRYPSITAAGEALKEVLAGNSFLDEGTVVTS